MKNKNAKIFFYSLHYVLALYLKIECVKVTKATFRCFLDVIWTSQELLKNDYLGFAQNSMLCLQKNRINRIFKT